MIEWEKLGFQYMQTKCHAQCVWKNGSWSQIELVEEPYLNLHIAATALHYGQAIFEGMKVFRGKDGKTRAFRPRDNAQRMIASATRLRMEPVPEDLFIETVDAVVKANSEFIPPYGTGGAMYVRPLLIGSGPRIGVRPADEYTFIVLVVPVGPYYKGGLKPVSAIVLEDYDRAAPQGVGHVKVAGNYAASLAPHHEASEKGYPVELYLDAREHRYVEEFGTSNFLGFTKDNTYVTAKSSSILPSITNKTLQQLCLDMGMQVEERAVEFDEIASFTEIGACGTAVVVTPVNKVVRGDQTICIGPEDGCGPMLEKLYKEVTGIQYGEKPDIHNWNHLIDC